MNHGLTNSDRKEKFGAIFILSLGGTNNQMKENYRNEKTLDPDAMISSKNYVKRKNFHGPVYDVDHLATFTISAKNGLLKAEDGMRKLRSMEKLHGVATMHCQVLIDPNYLVVYDKNSAQEVEIFPLDLVTEPTSVLSDDRHEALNNIVLFTVLEDNRKSKGNASTAPTEMHIFQSTRVHSSEIVDEIIRAKSSGSGSGPPTHRSEMTEAKYAPTTAEILNNNVYKQRAGHSAQVRPSKASSQVDFDVQVLNHCFDDIERFVTKLQNSIDSYKELEKRRKERKSNRKYMGDGMLTMRSQMPSTQNFVDIFQKIKLSLNLLAKLKAHIHDPNAPELVHFLFTPLALIVNTTREQPYQGIGKTVWTPLLTKEAKELLLNCLTSKEQDLWMSLGDGWVTTRQEATLQPTLLANLNNDVYNPVFYDGWSPKIGAEHQPVDRVEKLAMETAASVQANSHKYNPPLPIQKSRYYANTQPISLDEPRREPARDSVPESPRSAPLKNFDQMKRWASELVKHGAKVYEVVHDRQANNEKELSVRSGELVEVLDDKRNWWKLRNFYGHVGHAPVTILKPHETMSQYNNQDKVGYF
ncbi:epidermal growth factor receptor kinase substrate 8-like isoform X1 [Brachionus plicatilis]|uniref:Epidermal growth factor receptor kinase substrate 8-like isoform X1 n=1 Tax=Brachionus plicatilis TaxID=10195 RepID=A0A3M7SY72_BRAPC|nr:epidermal growth factor receptor kinase substrate 8-like isoform X1 [Brachionus plicatilis]